MADDFCNVMKAGASVNFYMVHGGTNFGFMAGANWFEPKKSDESGLIKGGYKSDITSYGTSHSSVFNEPQHVKTNKKSTVCPIEDSDQPGHLPSLISIFVVRLKNPWVLSYPLNVQQRLWWDLADAQADLNLCWGTGHYVGFVVLLLLFHIYYSQTCCGSQSGQFYTGVLCIASKLTLQIVSCIVRPNRTCQSFMLSNQLHIVNKIWDPAGEAEAANPANHWLLNC